jgi:hypothetical protein
VIINAALARRAIESDGVLMMSAAAKKGAP